MPAPENPCPINTGFALANLQYVGHIHRMKLRWLWITLFLLGLPGIQAAQLQLKELRVGSRVFKDVTVLGVNAADIYFTHDEGISNIKLKYLNEELQRRFNYDAQAATEAERQQAEDDARFKNELANRIQVEHLKAARKASNAVASSPLHLADAISETSLLGKPAPDLQPKQWLGPAPVLEGKFVLTLFWAPWSHPSRRAISELNALQKSLPETLAVVGITMETKEDIDEMPGPKCEFPLALDPDGKLTATAQVTSVPQVLLTNPGGVVLFHGHPSAITSTNLAALMAPKED